MRAEEIAPDWHTYSCLLAAYRRGLLFNRSVSTLSEMRASGLAPGLRAYTTAMQTCIRSRQWERAVDIADMLVEDMEKGLQQESDSAEVLLLVTLHFVHRFLLVCIQTAVSTPQLCSDSALLRASV
jgi:pentatricopeptide repeat protein